MKRKFVIENLRTQSVNSMYTTKRFITQEYAEWIMQVKYRLGNELDLQSIADLKSHFDPKIHKVHCTIVAKFKNFYAKSGEISGHTHDCSNFEKGAIDVFCSKSHFDIFNDKNITKLISEKEQSDNGSDSFTIEFEIINRPYLV
jgi:hypothetical protein